MAKTNAIELPGCDPIPILYEDRSVLAIDKPRGWMLVPHTWRRTNWNLQAALDSSMRAGDFWARCRNLKFLRYVHRLDADTTGVMLFARSEGALKTLGDLFETRQMDKIYLAVVAGKTSKPEWGCQLPLGPDPRRFGRMQVDRGQTGKTAETRFRTLDCNGRHSLIEARPLTGRTHQIRIHLAETGYPILGDEMYGVSDESHELGLRAMRLAYKDIFTRRHVEILAPMHDFLKEYGFSPNSLNSGAGSPATENKPAAKPSSIQNKRARPPSES